MNQDRLFLESSRKSLEDSFFLEQDKKLIESLRRMKKMEESCEAFALVSGITDKEVLQKLVDLQVRPETLASLAVVPLIEVAWADGEMDEKEKAAILAAVSTTGMPKDSIDYQLVEQWLTHKPQPQLLEAWTHYIKGLCGALDQTQIRTIRERLVGHARAVAQASGGFLGTGLGKKISAAEESMLARLESAFPAEHR